MIDVIIPAYNAHDFIENTLFSIVMQTLRKDINVYIVDDCSKKDYNSIVKKFKNVLNIKELKTDINSGPGIARQLGIDKSNSKYIVFIDADDIFDNCYAIERLYNAIEKENCNVVSSYFLEEYDKQMIPHEDNIIWLHGKIYRRSFLEENNIRFNNTKSNEDTGFNRLVSLCTDFYFIPNYTYIWRYNIKSITRSTDFKFYGLEGYIYNICWAIHEGEKRNIKKNKIANVLFGTILDIYIRYISYKDRKDRHILLEWSKDLKKEYIKYKDEINYDDKKEIINNIMNLASDMIEPDQLLNNDLSFEKFLEII